IPVCCACATQSGKSRQTHSNANFSAIVMVRKLSAQKARRIRPPRPAHRRSKRFMREAYGTSAGNTTAGVERPAAASVYLLNGQESGFSRGVLRGVLGARRTR